MTFIPLIIPGPRNRITCPAIESLSMMENQHE